MFTVSAGTCYHKGVALTEDMVKSLPRATGVYLLKDARGVPVYIGKANDVRSRVRSYLAEDGRPFTSRIAGETARVDFILTRNESEALLLENQLIKKHRPRYNIDLKDDKSYVRIKVSLSHPWPSISVTRTILKDGSRYFGPYASAQSTRRTLSALGRVFPLRRCKDTEFRNRKRPCVYHSIGMCLAPCVRPHVRREYDQAVLDLIEFLEGKDRDLVENMRRRMLEAADRLDFEEAARLRDRINALESTLVPQAVIAGTSSECDVFSFFESGPVVTVSVVRIAKGAIEDSRALSLRKAAQDDVVSMAVLQFYLAGNTVPPLVYLDDDAGSRHKTLGRALERLKGARVRVAVPRRGRPLEWLEIARQNARGHSLDKGPSALEEIAEAFHLKVLPFRMECLDVSTLGGTYSTASCVAFLGGEPAKNLYRRYRIRDDSAKDDYSMLREVLARRLAGDEARPDLLVIDGGKAQLNVFLRVARELGIESFPVVAMAKARGATQDRFYLPGRKDPVRLGPKSKAMLTLQRLRDEAHRFAVGYHRRLRSKGNITSLFEDIPGIGPVKARALLQLASRGRDISAIGRSDLEGLGCLNRKDIEHILDHLDRLRP